MKLSVVIPVFQQAEYISTAIESVLEQTVKPHEIIVVSDGSQDNAAEIASAYPIKVIRQVNKGLASARNTGILNATGDYVFFLDADDMMKEHCIEQVTKAIKETGADIIAPSFKTFGTTNEQVILMPNPTLEDFKFVNGLPMNRIGYFSAIKRDALLEVGGYSPKMTYGWEDLHLTLDLLHRGKKIVTIPEVLILYRTKDHSMIHGANAHSVELTDQLMKDFPTFFA